MMIEGEGGKEAKEEGEGSKHLSASRAAYTYNVEDPFFQGQVSSGEGVEIHIFYTLFSFLAHLPPPSLISGQE